MTTTHQYLDKYPISADDEKLIVGTIHPHDHYNFTIPFFYGNVTSIWTLLSEAFPKDLQQSLTLDGILKFLKSKKVSVFALIFFLSALTLLGQDVRRARIFKEEFNVISFQNTKIVITLIFKNSLNDSSGTIIRGFV